MLLHMRAHHQSEYAKEGEYRLLEQSFVGLPTQVEAEDVTVEFERAITGEHTKFKTQLQHKTYSVYQFTMLTPKDYGKFFTKLREGDLAGFRSELDVAMTRATVGG